MVMLSQLLRHRLTDARGQRARLLDVAVDLSGGDYPEVTRLVSRGPGQQQLILPWEAVEATDWRDRQIQVGDLSAGQELPPEALQRAVLVKRDILDALVL